MTDYSLDQFLVFAAVVDQGGFAAAARKLGRAQSAITYAIRGLEEQSGLLLFDRATYRPTLTAAGRALLPRARRVVAEFEDYRREAEGFAKGIEASLSLVLDTFVPLAPLTTKLAALHQAFPSVHVHLSIERHQVTLEMLRSGEAQIGLLIPMTPFGAEFESRQWLEHELVAVAAPTHPLAQLPTPIPPSALREHLQIVVTIHAAAAQGRDLGVHALDTWQVDSLESKQQLLRAGVGWGSMPDYLVAEDLSAGRLVKLQLESWEGSDRMPRYASSVVKLRETVLGPAGRFLMESLRGMSLSPQAE